MKFRPLHDRVVLRRVDEEQKTAGGIIIPDTAKEKPMQGEVVAVGPGARNEKGEIVALDVKVGDKAKVSIDAFPNRKFEAELKEIGSAARISGQYTQDEVTNFLVKIRINEPGVQLRPGMSATADIETQTVENVVAVPIQSVTVRATGGLTTEDLQKKAAKDAAGKATAEALLARIPAKGTVVTVAGSR